MWWNLEHSAPIWDTCPHLPLSWDLNRLCITSYPAVPRAWSCASPLCFPPSLLSSHRIFTPTPCGSSRHDLYERHERPISLMFPCFSRFLFVVNVSQRFLCAHETGIRITGAGVTKRYGHGAWRTCAQKKRYWLDGHTPISFFARLPSTCMFAFVLVSFAAMVHDGCMSDGLWAVVYGGVEKG